MGRLIFLLEEPSMKELLDRLLPRVFPDLAFHCVPHDGKDDLENNIRETLRNWREPNARFFVVRDNDNANCYALKERLRQICVEGRRNDTLVRIVCQELEAWYLGDPDALADAFHDEKLRMIKNQPRYGDPDAIQNPSDFVKRRIPSFGNISGARTMAQHLRPERNRSSSFAVFLSGIERLINTN